MKAWETKYVCVYISTIGDEGTQGGQPAGAGNVSRWPLAFEAIRNAQSKSLYRTVRIEV